MPLPWPATVIGIDLTDTHAVRRRPVDVAVLDTATGVVRFERLNYPENSRNWTGQVAAMVAEYGRDGCVTVVDGPQGLATPQNNSRAVERVLRTPRHTPWQMPQPNTRPFAGYIKTSVEFFEALVDANWLLADLDGADAARANLYEAYPGAAWPQLHLSSGSDLSPKSTRAGRMQRVEILIGLGCRLPTNNPTHDQLDACICAVLGWRYLRPVNSVAVGLVGVTPVYRDQDGRLREGRMLNPLRPQPTGAKITVEQVLAQAVDDETANDDGPRAEPPPGLSRCEWVYYAAGSIAGEFETYELAVQDGIICRTVHTRTATGLPRVASVARVQAGDTMLLAFRLGDGHARPLARFEVGEPDVPVGAAIAQAITRIVDPETVQLLTDLGYELDPQVVPPAGSRTFTGFDVKLIEDLQDSTVRFRPRGMNALYRWANVYRGK